TVSFDKLRTNGLKDETLKRSRIGVPEASSGLAGTWFRMTEMIKDEFAPLCFASQGADLA
ncbi:MAG: hypothetical protein L0213_04920, partial [Candidatus Dadabacteria bacterium]|nr:hypothetical protein [Candidatus Dadabacteria bacterium]